MTLKYIGTGFLRGVPRRDLSDAEVEKHGGEEFLVGTGLYEGENAELYRYATSREFLDSVHEAIAKDKREQQAPAAPIETPKRKTKRADPNKSVKDG